MQSFSKSDIAVGHQHNHLSIFSAFKQIYGEHGIKGLWRGSNSAVPRMAVASAAQLTSYDIFKRYFNETTVKFKIDFAVKIPRFFQIFQILSEDHKINSFVSSVLSSLVTAAVKTPFDVVSTRIYNQGTHVIFFSACKFLNKYFSQVLMFKEKVFCIPELEIASSRLLEKKGSLACTKVLAPPTWDLGPTSLSVLWSGIG